MNIIFGISTLKLCRNCLKLLETKLTDNRLFHKPYSSIFHAPCQQTHTFQRIMIKELYGMNEIPIRILVSNSVAIATHDRRSTRIIFISIFDILSLMISRRQNVIEVVLIVLLVFRKHNKQTRFRFSSWSLKGISVLTTTTLECEGREERTDFTGAYTCLIYETINSFQSCCDSDLDLLHLNFNLFQVTPSVLGWASYDVYQ